jgi:hypothetical protein
MADDDGSARLEIEGRDVDVEAVMQEIRARIRARRAEARARGFDYEAFADGLYPRPQDAILSHDLYEAVRTLSAAYDKVGVEMTLTERHLPVVGGLMQRLRAALHGLVLFYVNALASRQTRYNQQMTRALVTLVRDLEAEVHSLRARISALEAKHE